MATRRKCSKCGKVGHRAPTCGRDPKAATKKASGSWLKNLTTKLDDSLSTSASEKSTVEASAPQAGAFAETVEAPTSEKPGDPFAGLPSLDLPNSAPSSGDADAGVEVPSDTGKATEAGPKIEFSNDELVAIAEQVVTDAMNASALYCSERGFFAIGGPFSKIVGKAAGVIVKAQATKMEVDSEEGAAWILALAGGTNGVQCFRAYQSEKKKEAEKNKNERAQAAQPAPGSVPGNAATVTPIRPESPSPIGGGFTGGIV